MTRKIRTRKTRRLTIIAVAGCILAVALGLVLYAMNDTIVFFNSPADVQAKNVAPGTRFRLGGLVKEGSVRRGEKQQVEFEVMDAQSSIRVHYQGLLPDLFREGQGVVAEGRLEPSGVFRADTVLAKHDENYMPREVADALKRQGHWQGEGPASQQAKQN
ncbi:cytochrome c maturation protein CcmE [Microvirga thermotolerans]|uniref:Cytochrome c-type biogenesis protein CcmE n=1 Tax=Microvirga thermotolerans TaxID=2651334 RepID=A0A5P9K420_9HYPH|nr:cytochrome c maturation protein CcmE [Microvirga thermotolerans]QFU17064.1 cytochrome c maturation protein CcmE [Microvirga thermotolerans]